MICDDQDIYDSVNVADDDNIPNSDYNTTSTCNTPGSSTASISHAWSVLDVLHLNGCDDRCVTVKHGLNEFDILIAHSSFSSKEYLL